MVNLEDFVELGTSQVGTPDKSSGYPAEIWDRVSKCLISGKPSFVFEKNSIWQFCELETAITMKANSLLIIPSAKEGADLTWLELKSKTKNATYSISSKEANFLQWALAIKLDLHATASKDYEDNERDNLRNLSLLTIRQRQVVGLVRQGLTNGQISAQLHVSQSLVKYELNKIFRLLRVSKRSELLD
jgi:DNA-binding CsgD family transcriptional regulator